MVVVVDDGGKVDLYLYLEMMMSVGDGQIKNPFDIHHSNEVVKENNEKRRLKKSSPHR